MKFIKILTIFFLLFSYSYAKSSDMQNIVQMTKQLVYEFDTNGIKTTLLPYLKEKPNIERIVIKDNLTNEIIFAVKQHNSKQIIDKKTSFHCPKNLKETVSAINFRGETIGQISMCTTQNQNFSTLNLTQKEKNWIKAHPMITVHNELDWSPMNFNKNGTPTGFSIDLINLLAKKAGLKVKYITGEWNDLYIKAKNKKIDVMLNIAKTKEREKYFLFTSSYQKNSNAIYGRKNDHSISDIHSLFGKKVAMVDGFYYEEILRNKYPLIQIIPKKNTKETLQSVCIGEADATIGFFIVNNNLLNNMVCNNIEFKSEIPGNNDQDLYIAVRNDYPELQSILEKALVDVGSNELNKMRRKWISLNSKKRMIALTDKEHKWIEQHHVINVGGELDWAPFDFVDETNTYSGLTKDYLDLISSLTGITFKIHTGQTWNELVESLEQGKLDLLPAIYYNEKRKSYLNFTNPYLTITDFYITKKDHKKIDDIKELFGKKVAVIKGYQIVHWLQENYPKIQIVQYDTLLDALRSVESGETEATINDNPSATYVMEKNFITSLKINNIVKNRKPSALRMGVKKEYKPLVTIINKALANITREERKKISNRWMSEVKERSISLDFSPKEMQWLASKPTIKFAVDPHWLPIESINPKTTKYEGMMADYLDKIKELTGIQFKLIPTKTWDQSITLAKSNQVDMLAAVSMTPQRQKFLNFSNTTITLTDGVIMRNEGKFISNLSDLKGLKVGVSNGTSLHNLIKENYPDLTIVPTQGTVKGIQELEQGKINAFIGNLEVISYVIFSKNLLDLKVVLKLDKTRELHIALQKSYPKEALSVINKAISAISNEELNLIRQKWIGLKVDNNINYILFLKIAIAILVLILILAYYNRKLHKMVAHKTKDIQEQKQELEILIAQFDKNVIFSRTDLQGKITHVSEAFCKLSGYSDNELIGKPHNIVRHPDMDPEVFRSLWEILPKQACLTIEIKNKKKNGDFYWLESKFEPDYDKEGNHIGYTALRIDITNKKAVEELSKSLEDKVKERTQELNNERRYINSIMNSQENIVISTDGENLQTANKAFFRFFKVKTLDAFKLQYGKCISATFDPSSSNEFIQKNTNGTIWTDFILNTTDTFHKVKITLDEETYIFAISVDTFKHNEQFLKVAVFSDITELENIRQEIEMIHKHTQDSIEYASLIQHSLIPDNDLFRKYFKDYLTIWHPKDIIGGDIYLFEELRDDNECLLMVIDCTGHGVPGAFVTMLVKAIERQITAKIINSDEIVSPAKLLSIFNRSMKHLLKQDNQDSISNAGFDGGILYYNKKENIIKYAGAETPLFYIDDKKELKTIKGSRQSVGYKKSDNNYEFTEHIIPVHEGMQFYITTDGYLDQNGGKKSFPFGKKRFKALIEEYKDESFSDQQEVLLDTLAEYQQKETRNDDVTIVGIKI